MQTIVTLYLINVGISLATAIFGVVYGFFALFVVIYLEARIMKKRFSQLNLEQCIKYSLLVNLGSTIFGIPLLYFVSITPLYSQTPPEILTLMATNFTMAVFNIFAAIQVFRWIVIAFVITLVVEFCGLFVLMKPRPVFISVFHYSLTANFLSYLVIFLTPLIFEIGLGLLLLLNHQ